MPNRTLKESIRESESIDQLSAEAERTWYRLITYVDDYGLFKANVRLVNRALYPLKDFKDAQVEKWLDEIAAAGMLGFYQGEDGKPYGTILQWEQHNKPRNTKPKYPQPSENTTIYTELKALENNCMQLNTDGSECSRSSSSSRSRSRGAPTSEIKSKQKPNGKYPPPSLDDVLKYFRENGYSDQAAHKAFKYYEANKDPTSGNWKDAKGNIVKSWKQKMQGVWFKPENEAQAGQTAQLDPEEEKRRLDEVCS